MLRSVGKLFRGHCCAVRRRCCRIDAARKCRDGSTYTSLIAIAAKANPKMPCSEAVRTEGSWGDARRQHLGFADQRLRANEVGNVLGLFERSERQGTSNLDGQQSRSRLRGPCSARWNLPIPRMQRYVGSLKASKRDVSIAIRQEVALHSPRTCEHRIRVGAPRAEQVTRGARSEGIC